LFNWRSASSDAPSAARQSSRAHSNKALCDAVGNSAWSSREITSLESQARALNQRSSEDAKVRITISKKLDRRRKRRLGTSNNIPGISAEVWLVRALIASRRIGDDEGSTKVE
jgi:hypothetical protein